MEVRSEFKKGDAVPDSLVWRDANESGSVTFGADVAVERDETKVTIRPRRALAKDECLIRITGMKFPHGFVLPTELNSTCKFIQ